MADQPERTWRVALEWARYTPGLLAGGLAVAKRRILEGPRPLPEGLVPGHHQSAGWRATNPERLLPSDKCPDQGVQGWLRVTGPNLDNGRHERRGGSDYGHHR